MSNLKEIVLVCINNKWLVKGQFQGFKLAKKEGVKNPLSRAELKRLTAKEFGMVLLSNVRDIFLFCCYTGLAYIDVKQLKRKDIVTGMKEISGLIRPDRKPMQPQELGYHGGLYGDFGYADHRILWRIDHLMKVFCFGVFIC